MRITDLLKPQSILLGGQGFFFVIRAGRGRQKRTKNKPRRQRDYGGAVQMDSFHGKSLLTGENDLSL